MISLKIFVLHSFSFVKIYNKQDQNRKAFATSSLHLEGL